MHRQESRWGALLVALLGAVLWTGNAAAETGGYAGRSWEDSRATFVAGDMYSLAVDADGHVWAWGYNAAGQLGDGTLENRPTPVRVQNFSNISAVAAGFLHSLALHRDGTVWAWGRNGNGQLGLGPDLVGENRYTPVQVPGLTDVVALEASDSSSLALRQDGTVWAWGANWTGQLGDGTREQRDSPTQIAGLTDVVALTSSFGHVLALRRDGTVWAWGANWFGQLGDDPEMFDRPTAKPVPGLTEVVAIAAGGSHSLALRRDGTVWAWGGNGGGELGDGTSTNRLTPVQVQGLSDVVALDAYGNHSLAVCRNGTVWAWGFDDSGVFGHGAVNSIRRTPAQVPDLTGMAAISAGGRHVHALRRNGTLWGWGSNIFGQIGTGSPEGVLLPTQVMDLRHASGTSPAGIHGSPMGRFTP